ncbi:MAG: hypothetical protein M5R40_14965 [Anaerolineae bacterium]|nr:hypothetical protein [Anaerolineae bacterium]
MCGLRSGRPLPPLHELARVVRPGGVIAIAAWSSEQLLPGYPRLEARLRATAPGIAPFAHGQKPETHFLRTLGAFRALGFEDAAARTLVGEVRAPLTDGVRRALTGLLQMRWGGAQAEVSGADWAAFSTSASRRRRISS